MKDKLTYNSNAKLKNFSIDDIGKLSINDIKKLKEMFGPKPRKQKSKKVSIEDIENLNNNVRQNSEGMKGFTENSRNIQPSPFFRGNNPNNGFLLLENNSVDNSRFANKSNLNIDDINNVFKSNITPLLGNIRDEARNNLLTEFRPYLENFDNTTRFIKDDYQKFRNDTDRDIRDLYSMNQDDSSKPVIEIFDDDAGNFGGTKGSDSFISLDDKSEEGIKTGMHPNNEGLRYSDIYQDDGNFTGEDNPLAYNKVKDLLNRPRPELPDGFFNDDSEDDNQKFSYANDLLTLVNNTEPFDEGEYIKTLNKRFPHINKINNVPDYFVEDVDNNSEEEQEQEPEPQPQPQPQPQIDFNNIKQSNIFKHYMNGNIKSNEAVELYKRLGGTDNNIINAKGKGSINIIKGGISKLLKNKFNYNEKSKTKNVNYK